MYINSMIGENKNNYVAKWLLLITFLVALMIIVGGLTRLTDSGLSITKWDLITGIFPPLSLSDWEKSFALYKKIPEFQLINSSMTLEQFKVIYWWEYAHRLLGRIIGLFYFIPLLYFTFKKIIEKEKLFSLYAIMILICLQGFVGWYMVKSGLTERTDVSHYRLSIHLTLAFIIFILLFWNCLTYKNSKTFFSNKKNPFYLSLIFLILIMIQIFVGALVSGLDAGQIYNSWPLMNNNYFPDDSNIKNFFSLETLNNPSLLQFIHRNIAYLIIIFLIFFAIFVFKNEKLFYLKKNIIFVFIFLLLQIILGILTVISGAEIILASMHQVGSIFLISFSLILLFKSTE